MKKKKYIYITLILIIINFIYIQYQNKKIIDNQQKILKSIKETKCGNVHIDTNYECWVDKGMFNDESTLKIEVENE